ncbi:MAG TPA: hypothetical protein PLE80_12650, partial [Opitutaceae bacterium]|nr:hypothetical protein [Opitutaceae bacterium]
RAPMLLVNWRRGRKPKDDRLAVKIPRHVALQRGEFDGDDYCDLLHCHACVAARCRDRLKMAV